VPDRLTFDLSRPGSSHIWLQTFPTDTYSLIFGYGFREYSAVNAELSAMLSQTLKLPVSELKSLLIIFKAHVRTAVGGR
jgi:hypothetical protein